MDLDADGCAETCLETPEPECCLPPVNDQCVVYGDVDDTGQANVVDVVCIINVVLDAGGTLPVCLKVPVEDADLDCNGTVNIVDVVMEINTVLGIPIDTQLDANDDGCPDTCQ